jgi:RsiW-degrading membrane proteinase PrsW (M82 family)
MLLVLLIACLGAVIPTVVYVSIAWWLDRYEKEPLFLLALTFLWGAIPAVILAAISELAVMLPLIMHGTDGEIPVVGFQQSDQLPTAVMFTVAVVAPLVEETLKAVPLLFIFFVFRREFDGLMDGLLYGALVGFGFAMTENFFYIFVAGATAGLPAELLVFFLRTIVFGMMHALWSSVFGIGLAIARYTRSRRVALLAPCGGLLLGMLMHGIHNFAGVSAAQGSDWTLVLVAIMLGSYGLGCIAWLALVFVAGHGEAAWIRQELKEEVTAGLLTAEQEPKGRLYTSGPNSYEDLDTTLFDDGQPIDTEWSELS